MGIIRVEAWARVSSGDDEPGAEGRQRFEAFVAERRGEMVRVARRIVGDVAEAEDVVQETLVGVWGRWAEGGVSDVEAYAFRAVRLNALKRKERRRRGWVSLEGVEAEGEIRSSWAAAAARVDPVELERAIGRLPAGQRAVVRMRYYVGMSLAEVGRALSISANTAQSRCRYALAALRKALGSSSDYLD